MFDDEPRLPHNPRHLIQDAIRGWMKDPSRSLAELRDFADWLENASTACKEVARQKNLKEKCKWGA